MFVNLTNHPSEFWGKKQRDESEKYGEIIDMPFPSVSPYATDGEINSLLQDFLQRIETLRPDCVLVCGEFVLTYRLVAALKKLGIKAVSACSDRISKESLNSDGSIKKESVFEFVGYREY